MKKYFLSLVVLFLSLPTMAQMSGGGLILTTENVYYGFRLGAAFSAIRGNGSHAKSLKPGFTMGGVVGVRVNDQTPLFLESGVYYAQRGGRGEDYKCSLHYLEVPLLIKYGIETASDVSVLPFLGPAISFGLSGHIKETGLPGGTAFGDNRFNRFDIGVKLGSGIEYNMLYAEVGFQFGVVNVYNNPKGAIDEYSAYVNSLFINVGINF
jgi:hypothetical protein